MKSEGAKYEIKWCYRWQQTVAVSRHFFHGLIFFSATGRVWGLHSPGCVFHIDCIIVIVIDMEIIRTSRFFYRPRLLVRDPQKLRRRQEKKEN